MLSLMFIGHEFEWRFVFGIITAKNVPILL